MLKLKRSIVYLDLLHIFATTNNNNIKKIEIMKPREKALEFYNKYWAIMDTLSVKKSALIAVDEILSINKLQDIESQNYWQQVKQEIINL